MAKREREEKCTITWPWGGLIENVKSMDDPELDGLDTETYSKLSDLERSTNVLEILQHMKGVTYEFAHRMNSPLFDLLVLICNDEPITEKDRGVVEVKPCTRAQFFIRPTKHKPFDLTSWKFLWTHPQMALYDIEKMKSKWDFATYSNEFWTNQRDHPELLTVDQYDLFIFFHHVSWRSQSLEASEWLEESYLICTARIVHTLNLFRKNRFDIIRHLCANDCAEILMDEIFSEGTVADLEFLIQCGVKIPVCDDTVVMSVYPGQAEVVKYVLKAGNSSKHVLALAVRREAWDVYEMILNDKPKYSEIEAAFCEAWYYNHEDIMTELESMGVDREYSISCYREDQWAEPNFCYRRWLFEHKSRAEEGD